MMTKYEPWSGVQQLRDEMSRALSQALSKTDDGSNVVTSGWTPAVDIKEEDQRFVICADVPGVDPKDIDLTMEDGILTIKGERKLESDVNSENSYRRTERLYGTFYRRFSLPDTADAEKISAKGHNGVLEVIIPKKASVQPKRIEVVS